MTWPPSPVADLVIESQHLVMRPATRGDFRALRSLVLQPAHEADPDPLYSDTRHFPAPPTSARPLTRPLRGIGDLVAQEAVDRHYESWREWRPENWQLIGLITDKTSDGAIIGELSAAAVDFGTVPTLKAGIWLTRTAQHRGLAAEAAHAGLDFAFRHLGAATIIASIAEENTPSKRLISRHHNEAGPPQRVSDGNSTEIATQHGISNLWWLAANEHSERVEVRGFDPLQFGISHRRHEQTRQRRA